MTNGEDVGRKINLGGGWLGAAAEIDGAGGVAADEGVGEVDDFGADFGENFAEAGEEAFFGGIIGPEAEDAAGMEAGGEALEAGDGIEVGVAGVEEVGGRVVDVEEHGVEAAAGMGRIVAGGGGGGEGEEVAVHELAAGIGGEFGAEGNEAAAVPVDHGGEVIDNEERGDVGVFEDFPSGEAEAEAADDDVGRGGAEGGDAESGEGFFDGGEKGRHQVVVTEFYFVDFASAKHLEALAAQAHRAERGFLIVELFEIGGHGGELRRGGGKWHAQWWRGNERPGWPDARGGRSRRLLFLVGGGLGLGGLLVGDDLLFLFVSAVVFDLLLGGLLLIGFR